MVSQGILRISQERYFQLGVVVRDNTKNPEKDVTVFELLEYIYAFPQRQVAYTPQEIAKLAGEIADWGELEEED